MKKLEKKMKKITIRIESREVNDDGVHSERTPEGSYHIYHSLVKNKTELQNLIIYSLEKYAAILKNGNL
jgi:hypothetical protein